MAHHTNMLRPAARVDHRRIILQMDLEDVVTAARTLRKMLWWLVCHVVMFYVTPGRTFARR